jgi:hypothetical protein
VALTLADFFAEPALVFVLLELTGNPIFLLRPQGSKILQLRG